MQIEEYLEANEQTAKDFAEQLGLDQSYLSKLKKFKFTPSLIEILKIYRESDGYINIPDLISDEKLEAHGFTKKTVPKLY